MNPKVRNALLSTLIGALESGDSDVCVEVASLGTIFHDGALRDVANACYHVLTSPYADDNAAYRAAEACATDVEAEYR